MPKQSGPGQIGAAVGEFLQQAANAQRVLTTAEVRQVTSGGQAVRRTLSVDYRPQWAYVHDSSGHYAVQDAQTRLDDLWLALAARWPKAKLDPTTITVKTTKSPLANKEFKKLAVAAWCELFGVPAPSEEDLKQAAASGRAQKNSFAAEWLETLRGGAAGVKKWNAQQDVLRAKLRTWTNLELAQSKLTGLMMIGFICKGADFTGADLTRCQLNASRFPQAKLVGAKLKNASLKGTRFDEASVEGADFSSAELWSASFRQAHCKAASFAKAVMNFADLCGADLTDANLDGAVLEKASYDEHTIWPKGFTPTLEMNWKGPGASPAAHQLAKAKKPRKPLNLEQFMKRLGDLTDAAKLDKALKMLKADRFKLYAQVTDGFLVGVVKSQTDPDLVYSCKLAADGVYGCCTQNLNVCGGLRGSLCKHLLVLIVGLANGGELDPNTIDNWVLLSQGQKPVLDRDAMSETFLRYKGAEAGEVDWRPTETIPEDYYAL
jgi:uncharacterized protein YjbI with pentapeptide repeats